MRVIGKKYSMLKMFSEENVYYKNWKYILGRARV